MQKKYIEQMVTITSQGQVTIPQALRRVFKIQGSTKAFISHNDGAIVIKPRTAFNTLGGSLKSKVRLSDARLKRARLNFAKEFGRTL